MSKKLLLSLALILGLIAIPAVSAVSRKPNNEVVLSKNNLIVLNSEVDGESEGQVLSKAKELNSSNLLGLKHKGPIYLYLQTPGGSVQSGMEMIEVLKSSHRKVHTVTAFAASMGFQIAQNLGKRYVLKSGILMSHRAAGAMQGSFGGQEPSQLSSRLRVFIQQMKELDEQTVRRSNGKQTLESYQKAYDPELWVTGEEAVKQGYADEVVKVSCDSSLNGTTLHNTEFMGLQLTYELDNCPLNSSPMNVKIQMLTTKGSMSVEQFREYAGSFGSNCLQLAVLDNQKVCALDTTLSLEKIAVIKQKFGMKFEKNRSNVVPMTF